MHEPSATHPWPRRLWRAAAALVAFALTAIGLAIVGLTTVPSRLAGASPAWWAAPNGLGSPGRLPWSVGAFRSYAWWLPWVRPGGGSPGFGPGLRVGLGACLG
jgi:hypothetical protein